MRLLLFRPATGAPPRWAAWVVRARAWTEDMGRSCFRSRPVARGPGRSQLAGDPGASVAWTAGRQQAGSYTGGGLRHTRDGDIYDDGDHEEPGSNAVLIALLLLLLAAALTSWWLLRGSLPSLDGELALPGLSAPVSVQRDALGVVTVDAANEDDAMRALGYVHAQERYFEMDLLRRAAAGELSALFGPVAIDTDKQQRVHRMRARVTRNLDAILGDKRPHGAGLRRWRQCRPGRAQGAPVALPAAAHASPSRGSLEDSALAGYAMYFDLQDAEQRARTGDVEDQATPAASACIRCSRTTAAAGTRRWRAGRAAMRPCPTQATLDLRKLPMPKPTTKPADMPGALGRGQQQLRRVRPAHRRRSRHRRRRHAPGPARAATSGSAHACAIPTRAPSAAASTPPASPCPACRRWWSAATARSPGASPTAMATGSTGSASLPARRPAPALPAASSASASPARPTSSSPIDETAWGPIVHREPDGSGLALRWVAHLPGAMNLGLADFLHAHALDDALAMADQTAIPGQNLAIGDRNGRITWRLLGPVPQRQAQLHAGDRRRSRRTCAPWPITTASGIALPTGTRAAGVDRQHARRRWRVARARRRWRLRQSAHAPGRSATTCSPSRRFNERDLLAIQLDDRAVFLQRWWQLLRDQGASAQVACAARTGRGRGQLARPRQRRFGQLSHRTCLAPGRARPPARRPDRAGAGCARQATSRCPNLSHFEGVAWPLVTQRPANLLPRRFASWDALFEDAAREVRDELAKQGPLAQRSWGERNTARICHPLARALPAFARSALCACRPTHCRATVACRACRVRTSVHPNAWWCRRGTRPMESCTCPAGRAVICCRRSGARGTTIG